MRIFAFIIVCAAFFVGCASKSQVTKQQVIDALAKVEGKERAETSYVGWMAEVRPTCPDDATAHRKILEHIRQIEKTVAGMKKYVDETKDRLLHKTDHQAVLAASREVIRARRDFKRDPKWFGPEHEEVSLIAATDSKLPLVIRKLSATSIIGYDDSLRIEFGGGEPHQPAHDTFLRVLHLVGHSHHVSRVSCVSGIQDPAQLSVPFQKRVSFVNQQGRSLGKRPRD